MKICINSFPNTSALDLKLSEFDRRELLNSLSWLLGRIGYKLNDHDERDRIYAHTFKLLRLLSSQFTYEEAVEIKERINDIITRMPQPRNRNR